MSHLPVAGFCRGGRVKLAETCQAGNSTPRFLAAQRSAVSSRREEVAFVALAAQHNTRVCGPLCDPSGSSQAMPSLSGASTVLPALSFWIAIANRFAAHSTIKLPSSKPTVFRRRKAFLLCKNPCGGLRWGWGPRRSREMHRPRKEISRGNLLCAKSGLPSLSYPRLESAQKYVTLPDWENLCTGQPRGARGTAVPFVSGRVQRNPFQGVPLGNFFAEARHRASFRR